MIDEIFDRTYQDGRKQLHDGVDRGLTRIAASVGGAFDALHRIQFASPWHKRRARTSGCA